MHYNLLEVPEGYETDLALVIAPYFDPRFAKRLVETLSPNRVRFVLDDGARWKDIKSLEAACVGTDVKVALGSAQGIVHLKGFYFEFLNSTGNGPRKHRFLFGSTNATEAAFGGNGNAELIAATDLSAAHDSKLLTYLAKLVDAVEKDRKMRIPTVLFDPLKNSLNLHISPFTISPVGPAPGFDAWLQRGRLVAKYRDAQKFLNVEIRLSNPLPRDQVAEIFADQGLIPVGARDLVRYPYVGQQVAADDGVPQAVNPRAVKWKTRYCVWTRLGEWVSDDCYDHHKDIMIAKSSPSRNAKVTQLLAHQDDTKWKSRRKRAFLATIVRVWNGLRSADYSAADYLPSNAARLDRNIVSNRLGEKIETDLCLARIPDFVHRYVAGYDSPELPRFRQDTRAWDSFVDSWGESIVLEAAKPITWIEGNQGPRGSLVTWAIGVALKEVKGFDLKEMTAGDITSTLREYWTKKIPAKNVTLGECVSHYFKSGNTW